MIEELVVEFLDLEQDGGNCVYASAERSWELEEVSSSLHRSIF